MTRSCGPESLDFPVRPARTEEIGQGAGRRSSVRACVLGGQPGDRGPRLVRDGRIAPGRQGPPGPGLEPPADRLGGTGELGGMRRHLGQFDQPLVMIDAPHPSPPSGVAARRLSPARRPGRRGRPVARGRHHWPAPARGSPRGPTARPPGRHPEPPARPASRASWPEASPKRADGPRRDGPHRAGRPLWPTRGGLSRQRDRRAAPARNGPATRRPRRIVPARIARSADASQTRSSSGADCLALASAAVMPSTG